MGSGETPQAVVVVWVLVWGCVVVGVGGMVGIVDGRGEGEVAVGCVSAKKCLS